MSDILLSYEVSINLFVQIILFLLLTLAFINALFILKKYVKGASTSTQYSLEKSSYLVITIIYVTLIIKTLLLPFFTYTINTLSNLIPGAMCGAGVISANVYGQPLLILKIFIVIVTMLWLSLNAKDLRLKGFLYFKLKLWFFLLIYLLISVELTLELLYFSNLSTLSPVACCSTLYINTQESNPLPFDITLFTLVVLFYALYILILLAVFFKKRYLISLLSLLFLYISYLSITYFFSTYIYQLPSHKCPYCLLQSEYHYIGYFIYSSLIVATYYGVNISLFNPHIYKKVTLLYSLTVFFISINFIIYLLVNRTFL